MSAKCERVGERAAVPSNRPSPDLSPWPPQMKTAGKRGTGLASSISPNSCMGVRARTSKEGSGSMPQETRIVGLDVAKKKVDACIHSLGLRRSAPSTPEGEAELIAWLRSNGVRRAVMEASGGYERKPCARPGSRLSSSIRSGFVISPRRPGGWPRTIRSTPTQSPGSPRLFPTASPKRTMPRARRSPAWSRPGRP